MSNSPIQRDAVTNECLHLMAFNFQDQIMGKDVRIIVYIIITGNPD